jgi:hypothetical protein
LSLLRTTILYSVAVYHGLSYLSTTFNDVRYHNINNIFNFLLADLRLLSESEALILERSDLLLCYLAYEVHCAAQAIQRWRVEKTAGSRVEGERIYLLSAVF